MSKKQRIGLLGGTFDPIHFGHIIIAESTIINLNLDIIYFIPAFRHAIKSGDKISPSEVRYSMLNMAIQNYPYFKISRIELDRNEISYTIDTLKSFKTYENLPESELFYIIGLDNLHELHLWKEPEQIMKLSTLAVLKRTNVNSQDIFKKYAGKIIEAETPLIDISSTMIRERIREKKPWKSLVPAKVYDYIEKNKLYRE